MNCVGHPPGGSTRHRQNLSGQSHGGRGGHPLLQRQRGRVCGDVSGSGRSPHQGSVQGGPCQCTLHHIHRSVTRVSAVLASGLCNVFVFGTRDLFRMARANAPSSIFIGRSQGLLQSLQAVYSGLCNVFCVGWFNLYPSGICLGWPVPMHPPSHSWVGHKGLCSACKRCNVFVSGGSPCTCIPASHAVYGCLSQAIS